MSQLQDPAGIQTILDQIRSSQAWQDLAATSNRSSGLTSPSNEGMTTKTSSSGSSVASLLSQLRPAHQILESPTNSGVNNEREPALQLNHSESNFTTSQSDIAMVSMKDSCSLDLRDSMHILLQLTRDSAFVEEMNKVANCIWSQWLLIWLFHVDEAGSGYSWTTTMGGATISSQKVRRKTQGGKNQVFVPSLPKTTCWYVLEQVSLVPAFQSTMLRLVIGYSSLQAILTLE